MVKTLVECGADVNHRNCFGSSVLHRALYFNSEGNADATAEVEAFLIDNGAELFVTDSKMRLPLHLVFAKEGL